MPPANAPSHLTPADIAQQYGVNLSKVITWIHQGDLKAVNVAQSRDGRRPRWRISREALAAFEATRTSQAPAPPAPRRRRSSPLNIKRYI